MVLADRVGERFDAVVLAAATDTRPARIVIDQPAIIAACEGTPAQASRLSVRLAAADPATRTVLFSPAT